MNKLINLNAAMMREVLKTTSPMMISQLLMSISGFISVLILSWLSTEAFSASMLISSAQLVISIVPYALFFCMGPIVGQIAGSKQNPPQIGMIFRSALWVGVYISIPLMILLWFIQPILIAFGQPKELVIITAQYFHVFLWGLPAVAFMRVAMQILNGLFQQRITLYFSICSVILASLLGYMLVFGKWGMPQLGVPGLAWGFVIQAYLLDVIILLYLISNSAFQPFRLFCKDSFGAVWGIQKKLFSIGGPIVLQTGNELLSFFVTTIMVGWLGATALMAKQITVRYLLLLVIPLAALGQAAGLFVGKHFGKKEFDRMKSYTSAIMSIGLIYSLAVVVLFWFFPKPFIEVFVKYDPAQEAFFHLVAWLLVLIAISQVFDAIRTIITGALVGLSDTRFTMWVSFAFVWPVGITFAYLFGFTWHWGLIGITVAHLIATVIAAGFVYNRWRSLIAKKGMEEIKNDDVLYRASNNAT